MPYVKIQGQVIYSFYDSGDRPAYNFANYASGNVVIDGVNYPTREHAFQAHKVARHDIGNFLSKCKTADDARTYEGLKAPKGWHSGGSKDAMYKIVKAFAEQHQYFKDQLLSTGKTPIVEDTAGADYKDNTWGCGYLGTGENRLGVILMQVRGELQGLDYASALFEANALNTTALSIVQTLGDRSTYPGSHGILLQNHEGVSVLAADYNPDDDLSDLPVNPPSEGASSMEETDDGEMLYENFETALGCNIARKELDSDAQDIPGITFMDSVLMFEFYNERVAEALAKKFQLSITLDSNGYPYVILSYEQYESLKAEYAPMIRGASEDAGCTEEKYESIEKAIGHTIAKKELDVEIQDIPVITETDSGIRFDFAQERAAEALAKRCQVPFAFDPDKVCLYVVLNSEQYSSLLEEYMPMVSDDIDAYSETESLPPHFSDSEETLPMGSDGLGQSE